MAGLGVRHGVLLWQESRVKRHVRRKEATRPQAGQVEDSGYSNGRQLRSDHAIVTHEDQLHEL